MQDRKEFAKLVVFLFEKKVVGTTPTAQEVYTTIKQNKPEIMREQHISGFKSFVQVMRTVEEIQPANKFSPMRYKLIK